MRKQLLLLLFSIVGWGAWAQQPNIAPAATVTADGAGGGGCRTGPCSTLNDLNYGSCGTQQMWISTTPPNPVGVDYIEWNWPIAQAFDEMTIHHGNPSSRSLTGFLMQYWDGSQWVNAQTFSNLPQQCVNTVTFQRIVTSRMRITSFQMTGTGQTSNPNFREIEIFQASTSDDDAGVVSTNPVPAVCPGTYPVEVTIQNFGLNQIDSVNVDWEIDGVIQPGVVYANVLDTIGGSGSSSAQVVLGSYPFVANTNYVLKAWTSMPNNAADTANFNDTLEITLSLGAPTGLMADTTTSTTAEISWTAITGQAYGYIYGPTGFNPATGGTTVLPATTPSTITGLTPALLYDVYLFADCGSGIYSDTAGPVSFATLIQSPTGVNCPSNNPVTIFSEEFNSQGSWTGDISTSTGDWNYNSGPTGSANTGPLGAYSGSNYIYFEGSATGPASMVSPAINLTPATDSAELSFWLHAYGAEIVDFTIRASTSSATGPFTDTLFYMVGELQNSSADPWQEVGIRLEQYLGQSVWLEFIANNTGCCSGDISIDLMQVKTCGNICVDPSNLSAVNVTGNSANLSWTENSGATTWDVEFGPAGFTPTGTPTYAGVTTNPYTVTGLSPRTDYEYYVRSDCGGATGTSGWVGPYTFTTAIAGPSGVNCPSNNPVTIFTEEFNTQGSWTGDISTSTGDWNYNSGSTGSANTGPLGAYSGSNYIYFEGSATGPASMVSPAINLTQATDSAELTFWLHAYGADIIDFTVRASSSSATGPFTDTIFYLQGELQTASADPWQQVGARLDSYVGQTVWIEFVANNTGCCSGDISVDLMQVNTCGNICVDPSSGTAVNVTSTSADLDWTENSGATTWDIEFGPAGFTPTGTPTYAGVTTKPYGVTGLTPTTAYDFYVRSDCGGTTGQSGWVGPFTFISAIAGPTGVNCDTASSTTVLLEEFDSQGGWTGDISNSTGDWQYNSGSTGSSNTGPTGAHSGTNYIYFEASGAGPAAMVSPPINLTTATDSAELGFWLHAYGAHVGYLTVAVSNVGPTGPFSDTVFQYQGQVQTASSDPWQQVGVRLDQYVGQQIWLEFEANRTTSFSGDISLDSLYVEACGTFCLPEIYSVNNINVLSTDSAQLFVDTSSNNFQVEWGPCGFAQGTGTFGAGSNGIGLGGLAPNTCYDVYVRRDCGSVLSSWGGPFSFTTPCVSYTAPYSTSFDAQASPQLPGCWSTIQTANDIFTVTSTNHAVTIPSAPNAVEMNDGNPAILVTPEFSDLPSGQNQVRVKIAYEGGGTTSNDVLYIGTMSDPTDQSTFDHYDTLTMGSTNGDFLEYIFRLDNTALIDTNTYIAFSYGSVSGADAFYFDDFFYEVIPACPRPTSLGAMPATTDSVSVYWTTGGATGWEVQYGVTGFAVGSGTSVYANNDTLAITGLSPATTYDFYVRDTCGPVNGNSAWAGPYSFSTAVCDTANSCVFTVNLYDSFGDGWNGAEITFIQAGVPVATIGSNFLIGDSLVGIPVRLCDNLSTQILLSDAGGWPGEIGVTVTSPYPLQVASHTASSGVGTGDTLATFMASCALPSCPNPANLTTRNLLDSAATMAWDTVAAAGSYEVWFGPQGFFQGTQTTGGTRVFTSNDSLRVDTLVAGGCYEFLVRGVCSPGDSSLWSGPQVFCTPCAPLSPITLPLVEDFESHTGPIASDSTYFCTPFYDWTVERPGNTGEVLFVYSPSGGPSAPYNGAQSAGLTSLSSSDAIYLTLTVDMSNYSTTSAAAITLSFYLADHLDETSAGDKVWVRGSETDTWIEVLDWNSLTATTNWEYFDVRLDSTLAANSQMFSSTTQVRWGQQDNAAMNGGDGFSIDDVMIRAVTCPRPTGLGVGTVSATSADVNYTSPNAGTNFQISYGLNLSDPALGTQVVVTGTSNTLSGLTPSSDYCYFVREICAPGDTSIWSGPACFKTNCQVTTAPFFEDFELASGTTPPNCWINVQGEGSADWEFDDETSRQPTTADGDHTLGPNGGGIMAWLDDSDDEDSTNMLSPLIDVSSLTYPELSFWMWSETEGSNPIQQFPLHIDVNDGSGWVQDVAVFDVEDTMWTQYSVDLTPFGDTIQIRFSGEDLDGSFYKDIAIDDVMIADSATTSPCLAPTGLAVTTKGCDSIEVSWTSNTGGSIIQYGPTGFTPGQGTFSGIVNASSYTITGLTAGTTYDIWVADTCTGDTSAYDGPVTVMTDTVPKPSANINIVGDSISSATKYYGFTATGGAPGDSYSWDFGNGSSATGDSVWASYINNGPYDVVLTVTNSCGSATDTVSVLVDISLVENALSRSISMYPNPAKDEVNLSFRSQASAAAEIRVTDISGKTVMVINEDHINGEYKSKLDISELADGVYMVEITSGEMKAVRRLIKD